MLLIRRRGRIHLCEFSQTRSSCETMINSNQEMSNGRRKVIHQPFVRYGYFIFATHTHRVKLVLTATRSRIRGPAITVLCLRDFVVHDNLVHIFCTGKCQAWKGKGTDTAEGSILKDKKRHGHGGTKGRLERNGPICTSGQAILSLLMQRNSSDCAEK